MTPFLVWLEQQGDKILYLMRGLPGSGKSTTAKQLAGPGGVVFSTDDFFYDQGSYKFNPSLLGQHHASNQQRALQALQSGVSPIVIDNTNVMNWAMEPYVKMARQHGYRVEVREPDTPWKFDAEELSRRNTHGVPLSGIQKMLRQWQKSDY